jgi:hypothetical protein
VNDHRTGPMREDHWTGDPNNLFGGIISDLDQKMVVNSVIVVP